MTDDAPQQTYLASPDHSLHDILTVIAPIGIAVPGDGDFIARHRTPDPYGRSADK